LQFEILPAGKFFKLMRPIYIKRVFLVSYILLATAYLSAQQNFKLKYSKSAVYAGIEVGSKGVKMSLVEVDKNDQSHKAFNGLKDTAINTDFISFSQPSFQATLGALYSLYASAIKDYNIMPVNIFTVVSSGVKIQAEKENKNGWIKNLVDSFKLKIKDTERKVAIIDVLQEARLSHLGIVPESKRYITFLIDIGSGNTKGGYFPYGNTRDFRLFQLSWGTKSINNAVEKRCGDDKSILNYNKQLARVASEVENAEIIYAVNESGSYPKSDVIAFSGGIAWSVANLLHPELVNNSMVAVSYNEVVKFSEKLSGNYALFSDSALVKNIKDKSIDKITVAAEIKRVRQVFDQRSLMAGTALLLKTMRQFESVNEKKDFFLVKNGQVGWISAYVDQNTSK
jgi:hypothetical protein